MSQMLRNLLGALILATLMPALAQNFDLTTYLGYTGVVKQVIERHTNGRVHTTVFGPDGRSAVITLESPEGTARWGYSYDPATGLLTCIMRSLDSPVDGATTITTGFDELGRTAFEITDYGDSWGPIYHDYVYLEDGATVQVWGYRGESPEGEGWLSRAEHLDEYGRLLRREYGSDVLGLTSQTWTYGAHGYMETEATSDEAGEIVARSRFEYEFDEHGNWTKRTEYRWVEKLGRYENDGLVTTREITYF